MKRINSKPLFDFLEENSRYFTSVAFFGVLLTIILFIPQGSDTQLNQCLLIAQSSSLMLLILCLIPIFKKAQKSNAKSLQIFTILFFIVLSGLFGYLIYGYKEIIRGLFFIVAIILGFIHLTKILDDLKLLLKKNFKIFKEDILYTSFFIFILVNSIYLIIKGNWNSNFVEIILISDFFKNINNYLFIGYIIGIILQILVFISNLINKIIKLDL